ncbi:hypothetical protein EP227_03330 [bacterium]|nr:MAG: hypothetical protein EP227_03330 [bacterium]
MKTPMRLKEQIITILQDRNFDSLSNLPSSRKRTLTVLISLTYDKQTLIAWLAIEAIGLYTAKLAESDPETVRHTVERLLWMIRDESGGIGWSAPEILGEIVRNNQKLCSDIAPVIISFHEEPPLRAGVFRAAGRIGKDNTEMADYAGPIILSYLHSKDNSVRGYAAWALGELGITEALSGLEKLKSDTDIFTMYEEGKLEGKTVGKIAQQAIRKLRA